MKQLSQYIQEKLHISNYKKQEYNYHPETRDELKDVINKLIKERGNDADLNDIDISQITDMYTIFCNCNSNFNGDISKWDVSNVEDMASMFYNSDFNGDISKWDVSNVEDMTGMFKNSPLQKNPPKWYKKRNKK